ncbi:MAG TPA: hypothetical protein VIX12_00020, partial [Candidatus Binataceae bacterium]
MGKPLSQFEVYPLPVASASTKSELKLELQPPHVRFTPNSFLNLGVFKSSGSLAMLAAIRRASY